MFIWFYEFFKQNNNVIQRQIKRAENLYVQLIKPSEILTMTEDIEAAIQRLSISKDSYFLNHPRAKLADRDRFLGDERVKLIDLVESQKTNLPKSQYYLLLGQIANIADDYSPEADENLSKAIKLEPEMCEGCCKLSNILFIKFRSFSLNNIAI